MMLTLLDKQSSKPLTLALPGAVVMSLIDDTRYWPGGMCGHHRSMEVMEGVSSYTFFLTQCR